MSKRKIHFNPVLHVFLCGKYPCRFRAEINLFCIILYLYEIALNQGLSVFFINYFVQLKQN